MELAIYPPQELELNLQEIWQIPSVPSIYAIFERSPDNPLLLICRFIGRTPDLKDSIQVHLRVSETNVSLRYFMQSNKIKVVKFLDISEMAPQAVDREMDAWIDFFKPDCNP